MMKYYNIKAVDQSNNKKSIYNIFPKLYMSF